MTDDVTVTTLTVEAQVITRHLTANARAAMPCCDVVVDIPPRLDKRFKHHLCEHGCYLWRGVLHRPPWPDERVP